MTKHQAAPKWVWDRYSNRWRHGGRWASPPLKRQLRKDKRGNYIDDAGKRVPAHAPLSKPKVIKALKSLKKITKEATKPRKLPPTNRLKIKEIEHGESFTEMGRIIQSSFVNKKEPEEVADILDNILERASIHSAFEMDDILIYQHGFQFLVGPGKLSEEIKETLAEIAEKYKVIIKYMNLKDGAQIWVTLGNELKMRDTAIKALEKKEGIAKEIYKLLLEYWSEIYWWYWFETEESIYE